MAIISNSYSDDNTSTVLSPVNTICPGENTVDVLFVVGGVEEVVDVNTICPRDNTVDVVIVVEVVKEVIHVVLVVMDLSLSH